MIDEGALRALVPRVLAGLVRRGEDFDAAEDALQEALLEALRVWPEHPPDDPRAWLTTVATRRLVDARRSEVARAAPRGDDPRGATFRAHGGGRRHALRALLLLSPRARARVPGRADAARRRRPHHPRDRRRVLRPRGDDGAADQPRQAHPARAQPGPARRPGRRAAGALPRLHGRPRRPRGPGRRGDPARPPAHARHGGARGARAARADAPEPRPAPGAARRRGPDRDARPAGPWPVGHARDRRGRARAAVGARPAAPGPLPDRGRDRRPARRRGERRGDRLAADPRAGTTSSSR